MTDSFYRILYTAACKFYPIWAPWLCLVLTLVLLERLSMPPNAWDRHLLGLVHGFRCSWLDRFFALITWGGSLFVLAPLTAVLVTILIKQGHNGDAWLLTLSLSGAALFSRLAKLGFARPRPEYFPTIGELPADASYPSAHTAQIVAFGMALWWIAKPDKTGFVFYALIGMAVAVSRVYLQVHYPSDVLGGAVLAFLWYAGLFQMLQISGLLTR
ncbi:MAG: phosphatase PAP2 family protein [Gammaproteobacteria bacterium]